MPCLLRGGGGPLALAAVGLLDGQAIAILGINLLGDATNALVTGDWRALIGVPIASVMILYLSRKRQHFQ